MALVPWGGNSATSFSEPVSSPFAPNGIIYANDVNAAIRLPSLIASAVWNTLNIDDVTYNTSLDNTQTALSTTVLACGINYNSSLNKWVCPNKLSFTNGAEFNANTEFNSAISVTGATTLSSTLNVYGITRLSSTLNVSGDTTLSKLAVNGETTFSQNTYFEGRNVGSTVYGSYYDYDNHALKITSKSGTSDPIVTSISSTQISTPQISIIGISSIDASKNATGTPGEVAYDFGDISKGVYVFCVDIFIGTTQSYIAQSIFCYTSSTITGENTPAEIYFSSNFYGHATITKGRTNHIVVHIVEGGTNGTLGSTAYLYKLSGIIES